MPKKFYLVLVLIIENLLDLKLDDTLTYRSVAESYHLNTIEFLGMYLLGTTLWLLLTVPKVRRKPNKIYVNGVQETSFATETYSPNQNMDHKLLSGELNSLGKDSEQNLLMVIL